MSAVDLWAELIAARQNMAPPDRGLLERYGIADGDVLFLIGIANVVRVAGGLYEPDEHGGIAYLSPVLIEDPLTPEALCPAQSVRFGELVDLVAWHPRRPNSFALRYGSAEWLGSIEPQYFDPSPVPIRRSILRWFQTGCSGLVLLAGKRGAQHLLLTGCRGGVVAEDEAHAAELRAIMRQPWQAPPVTIARSEYHHAA